MCASLRECVRACVHACVCMYSCVVVQFYVADVDVDVD